MAKILAAAAAEEQHGAARQLKHHRSISSSAAASSVSIIISMALLACSVAAARQRRTAIMARRIARARSIITALVSSSYRARSSSRVASIAARNVTWRAYRNIARNASSNALPSSGIVCNWRISVSTYRAALTQQHQHHQRSASSSRSIALNNARAHRVTCSINVSWRRRENNVTSPL